MGLFYEEDKTFEELLQSKRNFVFIGEAGSGKSEIILNAAAYIAARVGHQEEKAASCQGVEASAGRHGSWPRVDLFDLDQTKPLYRSRDLASKFKDKGVAIHYQDQYLDAPVAVGGVRMSLAGDNYTLLDIGGGHQAARFAGAYSDLLSREDSVPVYVINPYRPWTRSVDGIDGTMKHILGSMRLDHIYLLANPNLGCETSVDEVIEGLGMVDELFEGYTTVNTACVRRDIIDSVKESLSKNDERGRRPDHSHEWNLFPLELYLTYEFA